LIVTNKHSGELLKTALAGEHRFLMGTPTAGTTRLSSPQKALDPATRWKAGDRVPYKGGTRSFQVEQAFIGGMGVVYVVTDTRSGEPFVVKGIREPLNLYQPVQQRFQREAQVWIALHKHPNIVQALNFEYLDGQPHLFLEYVTGGSLSEMIRRSELPVPRILRLAVEICRGMRHAANKGLVAHRDLKPDNILLTSNFSAKVTDFGLVKILNEPEVETDYEELADGWEALFGPRAALAGTRLTLSQGQGFGTKEYMSPEHWRSPSRTDIRSDIYSFGVMLYELLARVRPFYGKTRHELRDRHLNATPIALSAHRPGITPAIDQVVARCLNKRPEDRYPNFTELERDLTYILQHEFREVIPPILTRDQATLEETNERGTALFRLGKYDQALACFDDILNDSPGNPVAWANRGVVLAEMGELEHALQCLDTSLQYGPENAIVLANKGLTLAELGREREALPYFDRALRFDASLQVVWRYRSGILNRQGKHQLALHAAIQACQLDAADTIARLEEARALIALGRLGLARLALSQYESQVGGPSATTLLLWARVALGEGRYQHCLALCASIDAVEAEYREALLLNLECALRMGHFDEIKAVLEADKSRSFSRAALRLIEAELKGPRRSSPRLLAVAIDVALRVRNFDAACRWYERWQAVTADRRGNLPQPHLVTVEIWQQRVTSGRQRIAKGALLYHLKEYALAIQCLRLGLEKSPRHIRGWRLLGAACNQAGSYREALAAFQQVCSLEPDAADAWRDVAEAALRSREYKLALDTLSEAQRLLKEAPQVAFLRAVALFGLRRFGPANRQFERAIELDPDLSAAWWNKGLCLGQMGRLGEASRACQKARSLDARFWYHSSTVDQPVLPFPLQQEPIRMP